MAQRKTNQYRLQIIKKTGKHQGYTDIQFVIYFEASDDDYISHHVTWVFMCWQTDTEKGRRKRGTVYMHRKMNI